METPPVESTPAPASEPDIPPVPWTIRDTWLGVLLLVLFLAGTYLLAGFLPRNGLTRGISLVIIEPMILLPVVIIFVWRRISWRHLSFGKFKWDSLAIGCGTLILVYPLILVHNLILYYLGVRTQGDAIFQAIKNLGSPWFFALAAVILAPLAEEIVFRGFLFAGFRQRYGWVNALLLSSAIFAASHMQLVAFIPTFLLGAVLGFAYQRSNSLWPGMILHFLVNATALCLTLTAMQFGGI